MSALENQSTVIQLLRIYLNRKCIMTSQKRLGGGGGGGGRHFNLTHEIFYRNKDIEKIYDWLLC